MREVGVEHQPHGIGGSPVVAVVIPTWNSKDQLHKCLDALHAQEVRHVVIVVDNGSSDGTAESIGRRDDAIEVVRLQSNLGFAAGVNAGIGRARPFQAKYVVTLNDDAIVSPGWMRSIVEALEDSLGTGLAMGRTLSADGLTVESTGTSFSRWGTSSQRDHGQPASNACSQSGSVFAATGPATVYRAVTLDDVGGFDDDFFAYGEDTDLALRCRLAGWSAMYVASAEVRHIRGATSRRMDGLFVYRSVTNAPLIIAKNVPRGALLSVVPRFSAIYLARLARHVWRGEATLAGKGVAHMVRLMPGKLRDRWRIQGVRRLTVSEFCVQLSAGLPLQVRRRIERARNVICRSLRMPPNRHIGRKAGPATNVTEVGTNVP